MEIFKFSLVSCLVILLIPSCSLIDQLFLPANPEEQVHVTRTINLDSFTGVRSYTSANIEITEGEAFSIVATGPEDLISRMETKTVVNDSVLTFNKYERFNSKSQVDITINMPTVQYLENIGSGRMVGLNTFKTPYLSISLIGTGDIDLILDVKEVDVNLNGAGNVILVGKALKLNDQTRGTGNLLAFNLKAERASLWIYGTGHIEALVNSGLECGIYGTGSIYYRDNPSINSQIAGTGELINAN